MRLLRTSLPCLVVMGGLLAFVAATQVQAKPYASLPDLPYDYNALEPYIDEQTMRLHHDKHHAAYTDKLNQAMFEVRGFKEGDRAASLAPEDFLFEFFALTEPFPEHLKGLIPTIRNNLGGYVNHAMFWKVMAPPQQTPSDVVKRKTDFVNTPKPGRVKKELLGKHNWGEFEAFLEDFRKTARSVFGSGWVWLVWDPLEKKKPLWQEERLELKLVTTANQDNPLMQGLYPILCMDLWEHAYYLRYNNRRDEWIEAFLQIINWDQVEANLSEALEMYRRRALTLLAQTEAATNGDGGSNSNMFEKELQKGSVKKKSMEEIREERRKMRTHSEL
ncbi:Superoxide dismutase [Balamuthia mandrillaris]